MGLYIAFDRLTRLEAVATGWSRPFVFEQSSLLPKASRCKAMSVRHGVVRLVPASLRGWVSYHTPDHFVSPLAVARIRQSIVKGIDPNHGRQLRSIIGPVRMTSRDF